MIAPGAPLTPDRTFAQRYRLRARYGIDQRAGVEFWRGRDRLFDEDVALTILIGQYRDRYRVRVCQAALDQARRARRPGEDGPLPRWEVLGPSGDRELGPGVLGVIVGPWTPGTALPAARGQPVPAVDACRMTQPLATAVAHSHHHGVVLGVDRPHRLVVTEHGELAPAFPGPNPGATAQDDIRNVATALHVLLTGDRPAPGPVARPLSRLAPELPRELVVALALSRCPDAASGLGTIGPLLAVMSRVADGDIVATAPTGRPPTPVGRADEGPADPTARHGRIWPTHWRTAVVAAMVLAVVVLVAGGLVQVLRLIGR